MKIIGEDKPKQLDQRGKDLMEIGDKLYSSLKEENITIGELERIIAYLSVKSQNEVKTFKENKFVSEL